MHKFKDLEWHEKAFALPTVALVAFGAMGYFLVELCGSYMDEWPIRSASSVLSSLWYDKYLLLLAVSIVAGALLYLSFVRTAIWRVEWLDNNSGKNHTFCHFDPVDEFSLDL